MRNTGHVRTLAVLALLASACSGGSKQASAPQHPDGYELLELRAEGSPGLVSPAELAEDLGYLAPLTLKYIGNNSSGPSSIQNVVTGDTDFGGAFNGAVLKLIAAKAPITAIIGYYGVDDKRWSGFYVLDGKPIQKAADLLGKKIAMNTIGAHSEFMLKEYLARGGLSPEQFEKVTLVVVPPSNAEQALRGENVEVATLGDIFRDKALERGGIHPLFRDYDLYGEFTAGSYVMRNDFISKHPKTARKFVEAVSRALEWSKNTPREEIVARMSQIIQRRGRNENQDAIQYWKSYGVRTIDGKLSDRDFQVWIDWLVREHQLTAGQIKASDVYTTAPHAPGSS
jgi:ABC-type nitrate/sulfonate/bicarbonate transport system substrate-binding protein